MDNKTNGTASNFSNCQLMILGYSQAGAALVSLMSSLCVILFVFILKRHKKVTQRLIVYLNTAIFFNSTSFIIRGVGYKAMDYTIPCQMMGYYGQATGGFILAAIVCIIIEIIVNAFWQKGSGKYLETLYLVLIFIIPMLTAVIPFSTKDYGRSTAWCWITGDVMLYALWYVPLFLLIVFGGVIYFVGVCLIARKLRKNKNRYTSDRSREKQKEMLKELHQFRWYPVAYFILNLVPLANRIVHIFYDQLIFELWLTTGIIQGLQGTLVAILYFASSSTRKHIKQKMKNSNCCRMANRIQVESGESTPLSGSPQSSYERVPTPYSATS